MLLRTLTTLLFCLGLCCVAVWFSPFSAQTLRLFIRLAAFSLCTGEWLLPLVGLAIKTQLYMACLFSQGKRFQTFDSRHPNFSSPLLSIAAGFPPAKEKEFWLALRMSPWDLSYFDTTLPAWYKPSWELRRGDGADIFHCFSMTLFATLIRIGLSQIGMQNQSPN